MYVNVYCMFLHGLFSSLILVYSVSHIDVTADNPKGAYCFVVKLCGTENL